MHHQESSGRLNSRSLVLVLYKREHKLEYWPRLQKVEQKLSFIQTDFSKWVDDERDGEKPFGDDLDMEDKMGGIGGIRGMGDMGDFGGIDIQKVCYSLQPCRFPI